jgi:hypothetical protein
MCEGIGGCRGRLGRRASPLRPADAARDHVRQPHLARAHVPVLRGRRCSERLAPRPPGCARVGRVRPRDRGGDGSRARGADLLAGHRVVERRAGHRVAARHGLRARPRDARRCPARARGPQGVDVPAVRGRARRAGRTRLGPRGRRRLDHGRPVRARVPRARRTRRPERRPDRRPARRVRRGCPARAGRRVRRRRAALGARLPAPRVLVAAVEHADRRVRRLAREPRPAARRGHRRGPRGVARRPPAVRARLRDRLGRGWPEGRGGHPGREGARSARRRPRRRLDGRQRPRPDPGRAGLPGARRSASRTTGPDGSPSTCGAPGGSRRSAAAPTTDPARPPRPRRRRPR